MREQFVNSAGRRWRPYITYIIIAVNIAMFIIMTLSGGTEDIDVLTRFGAKVNTLILKGQYWRYLTSAFIHIGFPHIIFNMYGLYNMGSIVEELYGPSKYLFLYLIASIAGTISSFIFSQALSAGASGAIFGLFGAILYLGQKYPKIFSTSFGINILVVLGFNLVYGFSNTGIDNFAHIGGLIGGYLAANIVGLQGEKKLSLKKVLISVLTLIILTTGVAIGIDRNTSSWEYYYEMGADSYLEGNLSKSQEYLEKAVSKNKDSDDAHALLSLVYYRSGNETRGKEEYDSAVNINRDQPNLYFNLGNFFFSEKRYGEAESMFRKFVDVQPDLYEGYLNLGVAQNMQLKYNEAELNLKRAVEIAPDEFLTNVNLGYLYLDKGDLTTAKTYLEKAAKINPGDRDVKKSLEYIDSKI